MNMLDYLLLVWLGVSAMAGYNRGFLTVLGGLASSLLALAAAVIFRDDLAVYLEKEFHLQTMLVQAMADKLPQPALGGAPLGNLLPSLQTLPIIQEKLTGVAQMILVAAAFLLLYIVISIGLQLILKGLESPFKQGALGGVNRLAGLAVTTGKDLLIMAVVLGISYPFIQKGAAMGINSLVKANTAIDQLWLVPYLNMIFISLEKLLGISV
ncbi:MAG TPA: CvpA family protein [Syntrophomonas sp.]|nr:CvpA family protein [Syntrophomonas sp.]